MPIHDVEAPDGSVIKVEAPEGASNDAILAFAQQNYQKKSESTENPESGGIAAAKASVHDIMGQGALTLGKLGLMHPEDAQKSYEEHKQKSESIFKPTEEDWIHAPFTKMGELAGGSAPYMLAPIIGGALAEPLGIGALGAGVASAGQFIGSDIARQLDEGKKEGKNLADTSLTYATLAAIPQAALDTVSLHMIPGIRGIFAKAGQDITEKTAEMIAKKGIANTALDLGKASTVEGLTEAAQQVLERLQAGLNITDEDARKEYYDNFVGGAVLGGVLGAGGHFVEKTMQNKEENKYDSIMNSLRSSFDTGSTVPMTDVVNKVSDLTGEKDLNKIQNFLGGAQDRGHIETVPQPDDTLHIKFKQPTPIEQVDEQQKNANPDIYKPEVFDSHADLFKAIVPKLKKFGLEGVGIKIMDNIENGRADGLWANKIIHVAMNSDNPIGTMRHESVHALKELGGFKPNEWTVLTNKAKDEWVDKFIKKPNLYDEYKNQYLKDYGNLDGFDDYIHEEAIAEAFKHFDQTKPPAGLVGNIYYRIKQLFDTVRNGFQGNGFQTSDSIFRSLDEGKRAPVQLTEGQTNEQPRKENEQSNRYIFTPERHKFTREALQSYRQRFGATSKPYTREGGENGGRNGLLIPTQNFKESLQNVTPDVPPFQELGNNGAQVFHDAITQAKANNPSGASVHAYPMEDYMGMRMFLTPDKKAGFALKGNDIVSVFSDGTHKNAVNPMIQLAIQEGGRKLDAFDTILPHFYHNNGFVVTSRMKWNDEYAPEGWDKKHFEEYNNGEPDVVFMAYDPDNHDRPNAKQGKLTDDYDEAVQLQEKAINEKPYKYNLKKYDKEGNPIRPTENAVRPSEGSNQGISLNDRREGASTFVGHHYSKGERQYLSGSMYGSKDGIKGEEAKRLVQSTDPRIKKRVYFYIPHTQLNGRYLNPEQGLGSFKHEQTFNNILAPGVEMSRIVKATDATRNFNNFESAVIDAGYDGYAFPHMGMMVILNHDNVPVKSVGKLSLRAPNTPAFKRWFGNSKVVNEDGTPKVMYHGTAQDISEFRPKQANAIFVTDNPKFAETFSDMSENYMADEIINGGGNMPHNKLEMLRKEARRISNRDDTSFEDEFKNLVMKNLPSRGNIMPVFVRAENPFDYENPDHVFAVDNAYDHSMDSFPMQLIMNGAWKSIEDRDVQNAIKAAGFDAFYVREGGQKNLAVYEPTQLKSATGNQGTFDITKPDIRYNLSRLTKTDTVPTGGERIRQAYDDVSNNIKNDAYWTKLRVEWVDKVAGVTKSLGTARVVTSKDQQGNILHKKLEGLPQFDMHGKLRADLLLRAKAQAINLIKNGLLSGNVKVQHDGTLGVERSENNLARSLIEADKLDSAFKPLGLTGRSGIAEVARILRGEDIIKEDNEARLRGVGLLTKAKADRKEAKKLYKDGKFKEAQKMMRQVAKDRSEGYKLKGQNRELQVTEKHIAWAHRTLDRIPEIENVLNIWKEVNRGLVDLWVDTGLLDAETADKFKAQDRYVPLFKSREDLDEEGFFYGTGTGTKTSAKIKKLEGSTATRNIWENIDKHYAKMVSQAYENQSRRIGVDQLKYFGLAEITNRDDPRVNLRYKENGKEISAIVENPNDLAAFQSMQYELSPLMKTFVPMTKALRVGALLNPMYWVKQLIKDSIHGTLVANSGIVTPFHSTKEFVSILAKNSEEAKLLASRGVIGAVDSTLSMNEFLKQAGKEKYDPHAMSNAMHKIMQIHEASDAATRVAIYKKAYQDGLKKFNGDTVKATDFAVFKARESINFSVHGNSPLLNSLRSSIPFFSASITSLDTVYRAMTGHGLNAAEKAQARSIFVKRAAMMAVMSAMYAMLYQDNDEYKKQPDYVKDNNWLIPLPDGKTFVKIPTPFEVGFLFKTIPEASVRYMNGTSTGKEVLASYYAGLLQNLPANGMPVPQAVRPIFENITNHSFFTNQPIEGMGDQGLPVAMRGQRATEFSKMLSRNGLDKLNMSPAKIDNLFNGYFAELGTLTTGMASDLTYLAEGKEPPAKNIQNYEGIRQFVTDPNVSKAVSDFYSLEMNAKDMATAVNKMKSEGNIEGLQKIINDEDMKKTYASDAPLRKIGEEMTKLRKAINFYKETQGIDPEERRKRINELTQTYNKIAENGYTISNAIGLNR